MESRTVEVSVAGEASPREATFWYSHHGPIVARQGDKAWAAALAYEEEIGYLESKYHFMVAEDYQRTGRVPIRPDGYDWSRLVDGSTSDTEWQGIHPASDLMSLLNPERGYMQNNNIGPDTMLVGSPLVPERYPGYLYNQPALYTHQRGASAIARLEAKRESGGKWSEEEIVELALDRSVYQVERWVEEQRRAEAATSGKRSADNAELVRRIEEWNGVADPDSPHYRDQAEKLFSAGAMKPGWFTREELFADDGVNIAAEMRLVYEP